MNGGAVALGAGTRILIVDDDRMNRTLLHDVLTRDGYAATLAVDGQEAWDILDTDPGGFEAVLLDRRMPRMNGMELLTRIRADERLEDLPVIMQTAHSSSEDVVEGIKAGAFYYLAKPINLQILQSVVAQAVEGHRRLVTLHQDLERRSTAMTLLQNGVFRFQTPEDGNVLAVALAHSCVGSRNLVVGLSELFTNAVEHGNLAISFHEKTQLLEQHRWTEEIAHRLAMPEYARRWVTVEVYRAAGEIRFTISDEGAGFDWRRYLDMDPARAFLPHGRGIALARRLCFDRLVYLGRGNKVTCTLRQPAGHPVEAETSVRSLRDLSEDLSLAKVMQGELLPSMANLANLERQTGLRVSGLFQPAGPIGGDIWGMVPLDEFRVAVYLADFSGHGITAALNTFRLATLIAHMPDQRDQPAAYLENLNRQIVGVLPVGQYCTMLYGVLDRRANLFTYAAAAATRPLVVRLVDEQVHEGNGKGLPLGISPSASYEERSLPFPPGSLLFLYSDALAEARPPGGEPLGCSGVVGMLRRAMEEPGGLDAASIIGSIVSAGEDAPRVVDDLTAVCCLRPLSDFRPVQGGS